MHLAWYGVPPTGGSNRLDRLKPGLQAVRGCMVPMHGTKAVGAFHEPPPLPALSPASGGGEGGRRPGEGESDRFMAPMHGKNGVRAFHDLGHNASEPRALTKNFD